MNFLCLFFTIIQSIFQSIFLHVHVNKIIIIIITVAKKEKFAK